MGDVDPRFSTQTKARKSALDILFQADARGLSIRDVLEQQRDLAERPLRELTEVIVEGVAEHQQAIDQRITESCTNGWTLQRMPRVDRNLARMAIFEIDHTDTPDAVVVSEVVELASWLSTNESPAFLNGLLGQAVRTTTE
ncbi:transcription antitermination factor NusB [uncultured Tessaracoccus sp.]|uniref:transcription antitermination factor NusB n=1 Tax=uncultured Tessaracoccus sp. TaxID=905023 RepID=UPI00260FF073|nr:transcription antitermination factor NusB [uncultured Tessaracoccus sp.]